MIAATLPKLRTAEQPRIGVSVLATKGDRLLLGKRMKEPNQGLWVLPGGGIRLYETVENAAKRELWEEAGARILLREFLTLTEIIRPLEEHRIILTFLADLLSLENELRGGDDLGSPKLYTRTQLSFLPISDPVRPVLQTAGWLERHAASPL